MSQPINKATSSAPSAAPQSSKIKLILVGIVVALVAGGALYGFGLSKGNAQLASQKSTDDARIQSLQAQLNSSEQKLASVQNRVLLMQSRADLYRTALDLERRNFGVANNRLKESATMMGEIKNAPELDMTRLNALRDSINGTDINVAVDLEAQRKQVIGFATELEALTPKDAAPVAIEPSTTQEAGA